MFLLYTVPSLSSRAYGGHNYSMITLASNEMYNFLIWPMGVGGGGGLGVGTTIIISARMAAIHLLTPWQGQGLHAQQKVQEEGAASKDLSSVSLIRSVANSCTFAMLIIL